MIGIICTGNAAPEVVNMRQSRHFVLSRCAIHFLSGYLPIFQSRIYPCHDSFLRIFIKKKTYLIPLIGVISVLIDLILWNSNHDFNPYRKFIKPLIAAESYSSTSLLRLPSVLLAKVFVPSINANEAICYRWNVASILLHVYYMRSRR